MDFLTDPHDSDFLAGGLTLNPEQLQAVKHINGPLRIVAGPGTGKTRVIVERIAYLIENGYAKPENILALTFSRKAADEMRNRLALRLKISYSSFAVSTFHSFCLSAVRDNFWALGYAEPPTLLLSTEQWLRVKNMLKEESPAHWPYYGLVLEKDGFVQEVFDFILRAQENLHTPDTLRVIANNGHDDWVEIIDFYRRYQDELHQKNEIDYGGVIFQTVALLDGEPEVLQGYRDRFRFILVDEFQDTNYSQDKLLHLLQGNAGNICVVGDDDQAIHGFRGATVRNILDFEKRYGGKSIELKTNYRSVPGIVQAAAQVIKTNKDRIEKNPSANKEKHGDQIPIEGRSFTHYADEANWIAGKIIDLAGSGLAYRDMAVIFRSVKDSLAGLVFDKLRALGVPVRLTGATGELYSHPTVKTVLELISFLDARDLSDSSALAALLQSEMGMVSPFAVRLLRRESMRARKSLHDYITSNPTETAAGEAELLKAGKFVTIIHDLLKQEITSPADVVFAIWRSFGYFRDLVTCPCEGALEELSRKETLANLGRFIDDVKRFSERNPQTTIGEYLNMVEEGRFADVPNADPVDQLTDVVNVMTIHQAKGLEWEAVFMPGLIEGMFPHRFSQREIADPARLHVFVNPSLGPEAQHYEEERRLFYVGLTRAKSKLFLSYSITSGPSRENCTPSRFFEEAMASPYALSVSTNGSGAGLLSQAQAEIYFRRGLSAEDPLEQARSVYAMLKMDGCRAESWWENICETTCNYSPFPNRRLYLSASRLTCYRECPLKYKFESYWRLRAPQSAAMSRGSFVHTALETYHDPRISGEKTLERLLSILEQSWRDDVFPYKPVAKQAYKKSQQTLKKYFDRYGQSSDVLAVESVFTFALGDHTMTGRIDRVDRLPDGSLEIIDYKTSSSAMKHELAPLDLQLGIYDLAVQNCPELRELGVVSQVSYLFLETIGPRADGKRTYNPSDDTRQALLERINRCTEGILSEKFPAYPDIRDEWGDDLSEEENWWLTQQNPCFLCGWGWLCG